MSGRIGADAREMPANTGLVAYAFTNTGMKALSPEADLGYPVAMVHAPRGANGHSFCCAIHVNRECEECKRVLKFTPLPGVTRLQRCSVCKRVTTWRLVP